MNTALLSLALVVCLNVVYAGIVDVGCGGVTPEVGLDLGSLALRSGGRHLAAAADWQTCTTEEKTKIKGKALKKVGKVKTNRHCCVACKENPKCVAWSRGTKTKKCTLFADGNGMQKVKSAKFTTGWLEWRLT